MTKFFFPLLLIAVFAAGACNKKVAEPGADKTKPAPAASPTTGIKDTLSYYLGALIGQNLRESGFEGIKVDEFSAAFDAALKADKPIVEQGAAEAFLRRKGEEAQTRKFEGNKKAGVDFLAKNKTRAGVITTASGLQYEIVKAGNGPKPSADNLVKVHYHGTLVDGSVFDSSIERGEPIEFPVNGVIPGWVEALQLMPQGSKWKLYIPYELAYGETGAPPSIQPFSALIFEVELLEIKQQ